MNLEHESKQLQISWLEPRFTEGISLNRRESWLEPRFAEGI